MQQNILLSFVGANDPYAVGLVGDDQVEGPLLTVVRAPPFEHVVLFAAFGMTKQAHETQGVLEELYPKVSVSIMDLSLEDPTDYNALLAQLREQTTLLVSEMAGRAPAYSVSVGSGDPHIHACWLLLIASGELDAHVLLPHPPRYATDDAASVTEVDVPVRGLSQATTPAAVREPTAVYAPSTSTDASARGAPALGKVARAVGIHGEHPKWMAVLETAAAVAEHKVPVLVQGETGTGKGLVAQLIHRLSGRGKQAFVGLNCGALPEKLIESMLFGHKKGAFTGADRDQPGEFSLADGGTLFLDEVGELPLELQPKLLKVLEDGLVEPLGARKPTQVDVRVIAATNRDLKKAVHDKLFREDLYYRLSFALIDIPPLRDRRSDIHHIALHILSRLNATLRQPKRLSPAAIARLEAQPWDGNIRDLENVIGRSVLLAQNDVLEADDLLIEDAQDSSDPLSYLPVPHENFSLDEFLSSVRKQLILKALEIADGAQAGAARLLGVSPQAVHKFVRTSDD